MQNTRPKKKKKKTGSKIYDILIGVSYPGLRELQQV